MEFLFDCANIESIEKHSASYPVAGVTTNPTILKAEGAVDFFAHFKALRRLIGPDKSLHIQVTGAECGTMLAEADAILAGVDEGVYIKIPCTEQGYAAMRALKARGVRVTATAVYTKIQGFMAIACGADYVAPYCNRMQAMELDYEKTIAALRRMIEQERAETRILAASFKNIGQVCGALLAGAHAATLPPALLADAMRQPFIEKAVADFAADWAAVRGNVTIAQLAKGEKAAGPR